MTSVYSDKPSGHSPDRLVGAVKQGCFGQDDALNDDCRMSLALPDERTGKEPVLDLDFRKIVEDNLVLAEGFDEFFFLNFQNIAHPRPRNSAQEGAHGETSVSFSGLNPSVFCRWCVGNVTPLRLCCKTYFHHPKFYGVSST